MPLEKREIDLPLQGIKQAADQRAVPVDGSGILRNYVIDRASALRKRSGISGPVFASGTPNRATPLPLGGLHVLLNDGTSATTADLGASISRPDTSLTLGFAPFAPPDVLAREMFSSRGTGGGLSSKSQMYACKTLNYLVIAASVDIGGSDGVAISVYDSSTGACIVSGQRTTTTSATRAIPIVVLADGTNDDFLLIHDATGLSVTGIRYSVTSSGVVQQTFASLTTLATVGDLWDACLGTAGTLVLVFDNNGAPGLSLRVFNSTTLAPLAAAVALPGTVRPQALCVSFGSAGGINRLAIASTDQGTNAQRATLVNPGTSTVLGTTTTGSTSLSTTAVSACVVNPQGGAGALCAAYFWGNQLDGVSVTGVTDATTTRSQMHDGTGAAFGSIRVWHGVVPAAKPFAPTTTRCCVPLTVVNQQTPATTPSAEPHHGFVIVEALSNLSGGAPSLSAVPSLLAHHGHGRGAVALASARLSAAIPDSDGSFTICWSILDRAILSFAGTTPSIGTVLTRRAMVVKYRPLPSLWSTATSPPRPHSTAGATAMVAGSALCLAQGRGVTPAGFVHHPEVMRTTTTVTGSSPAWPSTIVNVRVRYVWFDSRGNEMPSAWSLPTAASVGAAANTRLDIFIRNPFAWAPDADIGGKNERHPFVEVAIQTATNGPFFRSKMIDLAGSASAVPSGQMPTNETIRLLVGVKSSDVSAETVDTGGVPNDPPPCAAYVSAGRQRWFLVSPEDNAVYYSKPAVSGVLPEWSLAFTLAPSEGTGRPVAALEFGDRILLVGTSGACYYVGDGPDANGGGSLFTGPYEAASGHGCDSPGSVCQTPNAIFWRTKHTIVSFDGSQCQPIGRDVQDELQSFPYTLSSDYYPAMNCAAWLVGDVDGRRAILLYDLTHQSWLCWVTGLATATDMSADSSGLYVVAGSRIGRYDDGMSGDGYDVSSINFPQGLIKTQAARLSSVNGFQRVWYVAVKYEGHDASATLTLRFYRDGKPTADGPFTKSVGLGVNIVRFHVPANLQRCSTFAVEIQDAQPNGPDVAPAGVSVIGVTLECGVKRGLRALPAAQKA